jgi:hypothetical protein
MGAGRVNTMKWIACAAIWVVAGVMAGMAGWDLGRAPLEVQLAKQAAAYAADKPQAATQAVYALQAAQDRGDALSTTLGATLQEIDQLTTEKHHALAQLSKATTGRPCLGGDALRLLDGAPGLRVAGLPQAAASAPGAGEPPGTAGGDSTWYSTDTQITGWAIDAGAAFETCRARLDALIAWHTPAK